ncbi:LexA family transcriptional regulator [Aliivibrio logei]|jgi:phage repressor protein C with HTH and peptisase S24 domain|uniref:Transcriptional regulator n=1 Tax=Aliivibrio logei 5S-186 TaxID=626086 RepID=A0ABX3AWB5_ALILO|nr:S24 family peptidase [Aliivibrio logei]OEF17029.1 transcriptional regulator [Aliivibrio logei 5S-186]
MSTDIEKQLDELKILTGTSKIIELANALGVARNTIQNWRTRGKIPERILIKAQQVADGGVNHSVINNETKYIELDFYDVEVSAGSGTLVVQEKQPEGIAFSSSFITNDIGVRPGNIFLMPVRGDSMIPTLQNQALIMVNRIEDFTGDGIYVFRFDGQLMVKRLQFTKTGLSIVSDNQTYKPWELTRKEMTTFDFEIIGEVVWAGQKV